MQEERNKLVYYEQQIVEMLGKDKEYIIPFLDDCGLWEGAWTVGSQGSRRKRELGFNGEFQSERAYYYAICIHF